MRSFCQRSDIVVNCVGRYIISGYDIAKVVVQNSRHYVDFAFEQFHFGRLRVLDSLAKKNNAALITGAGEAVGLSSILCAYAADSVPTLEKLTVCALETGTHDSQTGFSSFMNGALEPALNNQDYVDGRTRMSRWRNSSGSWPSPRTTN